jgi:beta-lactamase regulating signal transducer with metallopeptidase domain
MRNLLKTILFVLVFSALIVSTASVVMAQSGNPTSESYNVEIQKVTGVPWFLGVLFFIAVAVGLTVYKNRHQASRKKEVLNASCCAPIVEDGTAPFHPSED